MMKRIYDIENIVESQSVRAEGLEFFRIDGAVPAIFGGNNGGRLVGLNKCNG